ncbi:TetR/AcrR family transcriptional regulator [Streptomonospora litoralis]|uniref:Transcriptional regulator, TetR family n=1 Tax=Streptomonospora litoralis TaxID=2498135 RepID=A0A4P6Q324_9ACTN|nr:TetR/AcrR family transcriptional regulator [Streptomonospora litoralis]QBI55068.1 Transcriptional regulator, TetR family [Streptomonospora litoralis]
MPRAGLTPAAVTEEAARICDEQGYDRLSLAAVAKRLGVAVPSLYKHVGGLEALRREVGMAAAADFARVLGDAAIGRAGADALRRVLHAYRDYASTRPGRYAALQRAPRSEVDEEAAAVFSRSMEVLVPVVQGFGLADDVLVDAIRTLRSTVHGFVDLETRRGFGLPQSIDRSFEVLVESLVRTLRDWPASADSADVGDPAEG